MPVQKKRIYEGDTFRINALCVTRSDNPRIHDKVSVVPQFASVSLYNVIEQKDVVLGDNGETDDTATVEGNRVTYLFDGSLFEANGDYKAFLTVTFADGQTITRVSQFRVMPKE